MYIEDVLILLLHCVIGSSTNEAKGKILHFGLKQKVPGLCCHHQLCNYSALYYLNEYHNHKYHFKKFE